MRLGIFVLVCIQVLALGCSANKEASVSQQSGSFDSNQTDESFAEEIDQLEVLDESLASRDLFANYQAYVRPDSFIKVGHHCDASRFPSDLARRNSDLANATGRIQIRLHRKKLAFLTDANVRQQILVALRRGRGVLNASELQLALQSNLEASSVCVIQSDTLRRQVRDGNLPLTQYLASHCSDLQPYSVGMDVDSAAKDDILKYLEDAIQRNESNQERIIQALMPYKLIIGEADSIEKVYTAVDLGLIFDDLSQLTVPVFTKSLYERAEINWDGTLAFMYNSASNSRCDYERLLGELE